MWWWLLASLSHGADRACERVGFAEVLEVESPSVLVLGARHGTQPDLLRAARIVEALEAQGPVTLALDAVHHDRSVVLEQFRKGQLPPSALPEALKWVGEFGFPYAPYTDLLTLPSRRVIGVGLSPSDALGEDENIQLPLGYMDILGDAMGGHDVPLKQQVRFLERVSGQDQLIGQLALDGWDGEGVLVLLVDRLRVEGGMGVAWQLERMTDISVSSAVLAWAKSPCYRGDRVWRWTLSG